MSMGSQKSEKIEQHRATIEIHAKHLMNGTGFMIRWVGGSMEQAPEDTDDGSAKQGKADDFQAVSDGSGIGDRRRRRLGVGFRTRGAAHENPYDGQQQGSGEGSIAPGAG